MGGLYILKGIIRYLKRSIYFICKKKKKKKKKKEKKEEVQKEHEECKEQEVTNKHIATNSSKFHSEYISITFQSKWMTTYV